MPPEFEWDPNKAGTNKKRHRVSFEEARTVFYDENARFIADPDHSRGEERFLLLGMSSKPRLLVVCHCYRKADAVIRIISARTASKKEKALYEGRMR